jgi:hypothetical protein
MLLLGWTSIGSKHPLGVIPALVAGIYLVLATALQGMRE